MLNKQPNLKQDCERFVYRNTKLYFDYINCQTQDEMSVK